MSFRSRAQQHRRIPISSYDFGRYRSSFSFHISLDTSSLSDKPKPHVKGRVVVSQQRPDQSGLERESDNPNNQIRNSHDSCSHREFSGFDRSTKTLDDLTRSTLLDIGAFNTRVTVTGTSAVAADDLVTSLFDLPTGLNS